LIHYPFKEPCLAVAPPLPYPVVRHAAAVGALLIPLLLACGEPGPAFAEADAVLCEPDPSGSVVFQPLPMRAPPPAVTTGSVPHRQIDPDIIPAVIEELHARVFDLSEVEPRQSTIVSDATAIWIRREINIARPECIISGREVAHIHLDGSLHAVVPHGRIPDAESAGWVERHPWAELEPGFEAFVLIFSLRSSEEVDVALELVINGLDFVIGS